MPLIFSAGNLLIVFARNLLIVFARNLLIVFAEELAHRLCEERSAEAIYICWLRLRGDCFGVIAAFLATPRNDDTSPRNDGDDGDDGDDGKASTKVLHQKCCGR